MAKKEPEPMKVEVKKGTKGKEDRLIIDLPIDNPIEASRSGKTDIVASSHGNQNTKVVVDCRELWVGCNAFLYNKK